MKSKLFLTVVFTICLSFANAQTYYPFPASSDSATWSVEFGAYPIPFGNYVIIGTTFYGVMGDTMINSNLYSKVYDCGFSFTNDSSFNPANATYAFAIRENNKQIFLKFPHFTSDELLYDFNLALGDSFYFYRSPLLGWHFVTSVDSQFINGSYRSTLTFDHTDTWIEGIGSDAGPIQSNMLIGNIYTTLLCYSENNNTLYSPLNDCYRMATSGINDNDISKNVKIYPNPMTDKLTVTNSNNAPSEIIIYDITSRKLLQKTFTNTISLNTEQLAKGIYLYEVRRNGISMSGKIVKE